MAYLVGFQAPEFRRNTQRASLPILLALLQTLDGEREERLAHAILTALDAITGENRRFMGELPREWWEVASE